MLGTVGPDLTHHQEDAAGSRLWRMSADATSTPIPHRVTPRRRQPPTAAPAPLPRRQDPDWRW